MTSLSPEIEQRLQEEQFQIEHPTEKDVFGEPTYADVLFVEDVEEILQEALEEKEKRISLESLKLGRMVIIWSGEHQSWWRENANGYTKNRDEAGLYSLQRAIKVSGHCGSEKQIYFEFIGALGAEEKKEEENTGIYCPACLTHISEKLAQEIELSRASGTIKCHGCGEYYDYSLNQGEYHMAMHKEEPVPEAWREELQKEFESIRRYELTESAAIWNEPVERCLKKSEQFIESLLAAQESRHKKEIERLKEKVSEWFDQEMENNKGSRLTYESLGEDKNKILKYFS